MDLHIYNPSFNRNLWIWIYIFTILAAIGVYEYGFTCTSCIYSECGPLSSECLLQTIALCWDLTDIRWKPLDSAKLCHCARLGNCFYDNRCMFLHRWDFALALNRNVVFHKSELCKPCSYIIGKDPGNLDKIIKDYKFTFGGEVMKGKLCKLKL